MFASIVTEERCQLYTVIKTHLATFEKEVLPIAPSDFIPAVNTAAWYQRKFDPNKEHYDFRVHMVG